jgi:OmcA/MtrC family decaheme c-type cytochrome
MSSYRERLSLALSRTPRIRPAAALLLVLLLVTGVALISATHSPTLTPNNKAYYLSQPEVDFIRPGLVITITAANIASDGSIRTRFRLTDPKGLPLDRDGILAPGPISVSFIVGYIPKGATQYVAYSKRTRTGTTGITVEQAAGESTGIFEKVADGEYQYTFTATAPSGFDKSVTHTIAAYGSRNLTEYNLGRQYDDNIFSWVPDGSKVTVTRDVIRTATCNKCHYDMGFHGGSRKTMEVCVMCHQPQTKEAGEGKTVDMAVMIHKIHAGSSLPSVKAGKKYAIGSADYSDITFMPDTRQCTVCHEQGTAAQAANVYKPNSAACGSCHDDVNFQTGLNHVNLPVSDNQCANCHQKQGELEFDASIIGGHTIPKFSKELPGVVFDILAAEGVAPGKNPTVTFSIKDNKGNPVQPSTMTSLSIRAAGSVDNFSARISETPTAAQGNGGRFFWTFINPIPATATGTWVITIEGSKNATIMAGTTRQQTVREYGVNKMFFIPVTGKVTPRRSVVTTAKCMVCHQNNFTFHSGGRNVAEFCPVCHTAAFTAGSGAAAVSIDQPVMIHRIHAGNTLTRPYSIGSVNYNTVGYPGDLRNCAACHVGGSETLPAKAGQSNVTDPNGPLQPLTPEAAACSGCHDSVNAAAHMQSNTTTLGESCSVCHGVNSEFSVTRVHAQ